MRPAPISLQMKQVEAELEEFRELLNSNSELKERDHILPFFKAHPHLSAFLGIYSNGSVPDRYAHEYQIGGVFACDLMAGDSVSNEYVFVEFEDGRRDSVFEYNPKRKVPEWSRRFEHAFSQIVDWFYCLEDIKQTQLFTRDFPGGIPTFIGMLVIGRSSFLTPAEKARLAWRQDKVTLNTRHVLIFTFDELLESIERNIKFRKSFWAT